MPARTKIGIVTVTYNSGEVLEDFLSSLDAQTHDNFVLYAIDNASSDSTLEQLAPPRNFPVVVTANADNVGIAVGNNQGIIQALADKCDWVLLLNNDTILPPTTIDALADSAVRNSAEILSPLIEASEPPSTIWYAGGQIKSVARAFQPSHELIGEPLAAAPESVMDTAYASTCCLLVAPSVFQSVGLMDPVYFVYYDDLDFAIRAGRAGHQYVLDPSILMLHKASSLTGGPESKFTIHWMSRNWIILARRHAHGIGLPLALGFITAWTFGRWMLRKDSARLLVPRLRAYREGLTVSLKSSPPSL